MSKIGYFGEFVFYPVAIVGLMAIASWQASAAGWAASVAALGAGLLLWTLVEYLLHRYVLHHMPYIKQMHQAHHDEQNALIGTPIWISLGSFAVLLVAPAWFLFGPTVTAALTAGTMLGYLGFESVHHVLHHWRIRPGTYAYALKRRHMLHHHFDDAGNFGVTNGFWDVALGTDIKVGGPGRAPVLDRP